MKTGADSLFASRSALFIAGLCAVILAAKAVLVFRINVNWDEFIFLSQVYEAERGDLGSRFQTAYVHLFGWLTDLGGDEMDRIIAARLAMFVLLVVSVILLARLAHRWVPASVAWIAPLTFLSALPVLRHSASFRSDSLLLPLMLLACVCLVSRRLDARRLGVAGLALGISVAISLKVVLVLPLAVMLLITNPTGETSSPGGRLVVASTRVAWFCAWMAGSAGLLLGLHWLSLPASDPTTIQGFASGVARKTVIETPFFPRWDYFSRSLEDDWLVWASIGVGTLTAFAGSWRAALLALSLLPLLFYRNAFPYFYVIMLAPACVLTAIAVDRLCSLSGDRASRGGWLPLIASVPLALQSGLYMVDLSHDGQVDQRATIDAVHEIFPQPVPYIDHSGMIASFPKVNMFMSSWAIENYRSRGGSFVAPAIAASRPPMLLANSAVLRPGAPAFDLLLEEDRRYIESYYLPYWGAIRVAGGQAAFDRSSVAHLEVPFPGRYRLEADHPVVVGGVRYLAGAEIDVPEGGAPHVVTVESEKAQLVRLVWAAARPAPPGELPPFVSLYSNL